MHGLMTCCNMYTRKQVHEVKGLAEDRETWKKETPTFLIEDSTEEKEDNKLSSII